MTSEFLPYREGIVIDAMESTHPSSLTCHNSRVTEFSATDSTYFGYVLSGEVFVTTSKHQRFPLNPEMYFSVPGKFKVEGTGKAVVIRRRDYLGLFHFGGPIEDVGRLAYIDGCRATNLINPAKVGEACLHLLTFPPRILQSAHTHPSLRMGVVAKGSGFCIMPGQAKIALSPGTVFCIRANQAHNFESSAEGLIVIAYHPDSEVGPTDEIHQMKMATILKK